MSWMPGKTKNAFECNLALNRVRATASPFHEELLDGGTALTVGYAKDNCIATTICGGYLLLAGMFTWW